MAKQNKELSLRLYSKEKREIGQRYHQQYFEDAENRIKNVGYFKFNNFNTLEYMDTQIFTVNKIEDFDYFNHGDQTFINSDKTK